MCVPQSEASLATGVGGLTISPSIAELAKAQGPSRTVTGVLTSRLMSRDIKIDSFSMGLNGIELIQVCPVPYTPLFHVLVWPIVTTSFTDVIWPESMVLKKIQLCIINMHWYVAAA